MGNATDHPRHDLTPTERFVGGAAVNAETTAEAAELVRLERLEQQVDRIEGLLAELLKYPDAAARLRAALEREREDRLPVARLDEQAG